MNVLGVTSSCSDVFERLELYLPIQHICIVCAVKKNNNNYCRALHFILRMRLERVFRFGILRWPHITSSASPCDRHRTRQTNPIHKYRSIVTPYTAIVLRRETGYSASVVSFIVARQTVDDGRFLNRSCWNLFSICYLLTGTAITDV